MVGTGGAGASLKGEHSCLYHNTAAPKRLRCPCTSSGSAFVPPAPTPPSHPTLVPPAPVPPATLPLCPQYPYPQPPCPCTPSHCGPHPHCLQPPSLFAPHTLLTKLSMLQGWGIVGATGSSQGLCHGLSQALPGTPPRPKGSVGLGTCQLLRQGAGRLRALFLFSLFCSKRTQFFATTRGPPSAESQEDLGKDSALGPLPRPGHTGPPQHCSPASPPGTSLEFWGIRGFVCFPCAFNGAPEWKGRRNMSAGQPGWGTTGPQAGEWGPGAAGEGHGASIHPVAPWGGCCHIQDSLKG